MSRCARGHRHSFGLGQTHAWQGPPIHAALMARFKTLTLAFWLLMLTAALLPCAAQAQPANDKPLPELLAQKRWPEALAAIDRALKERPRDTQLLMNRGAVLSNLNREGEALQVFKAVAAANPRLPAAHNNMAVILAAMGRYDEARAALLLAIKAQPNYATAHENLGDLHAHQAAEAYRKALEIDPALKTAKTKLGLTADIITLATGVRPPGPTTAAKPPAAAAAAAAATPVVTPGAAAPALAAAAAASPVAAKAPTAPSAAVSEVASAAKPVPAAAPASPVASAAVARAAAAPTASAAAAAPRPAASAPAGPDPAAAEVEAAVRAWARAWSRRDGARYVAAYADDYRGGTDTAPIWRELAQKRLRERSSIRVELSQLAVEVDGNTARARFEQTYESDQPGSRMRTRKTLVFQKTNGRWLIHEERRN
jgi:tetratricopeptide (TPR) repeat protein